MAAMVVDCGGCDGVCWGWADLFSGLGIRHRRVRAGAMFGGHHGVLYGQYPVVSVSKESLARPGDNGMGDVLRRAVFRADQSGERP